MRLPGCTGLLSGSSQVNRGELRNTKPYSDKKATCEIKQRNTQFEKLNLVCEHRLNRIKAQRTNFDQVHHYLFFQIRKDFIIYSYYTSCPISDNLANYNRNQVYG